MIARRAALAAYLVVLAGLTLLPQSSSTVEGLSLCLLCGSRGLADALLNVLLFVPLGLLVQGRWAVVLGLAVALSGGIELLQLVVAGRHATPSDVLFNTLGALAGWGLGRISRYWIHPTQYWGDRMGTVAAVAAVLTLPLTAWLAERQLPDPPYRVEWTTSRPDVEPYGGRVLVGAVQPLRLAPGPSAQGEAARRLIEGGAFLGVVVRAGPPPRDLAQVLGLYDARGRMVVQLGVDSTDLVYRESTRASRLGLDNPDHRMRGALDSIAAGSVVRLATGRLRGQRCFLVDSEVSCGYGVAGDHLWRFLYALNGAPAWRLTVVSAAWLALLLFPVGYWARWHLATGLAATVALFAWLRAPGEFALLPVPPLELTGVAVGLVCGLLLRRLVRRRG